MQFVTTPQGMLKATGGALGTRIVEHPAGPAVSLLNEWATPAETVSPRMQIAARGAEVFHLPDELVGALLGDLEPAFSR